MGRHHTPPHLGPQQKPFRKKASRPKPKRKAEHKHSLDAEANEERHAAVCSCLCPSNMCWQRLTAMPVTKPEAVSELRPEARLKIRLHHLTLTLREPLCKTLRVSPWQHTLHSVTRYKKHHPPAPHLVGKRYNAPSSSVAGYPTVWLFRM